MKYFFTVLLLTALIHSAEGQSYAFGVKGGPDICTQNWSGFSREPMIAWQGDLFIESHSDISPSSLYLQLGHHIRGSKLRYYSYNYQTNQERRSSTKAKFKNIVLAAGAKRRHDVGAGKAYYMLALRGEYTYDTDLDDLGDYSGTENKIVAGVTVGGGYEMPFSRFVSGIFELSICPDFTKQIFIPRQEVNTGGYTYSLSEQNVTNVTVEISVGLRFLREITYYD